jgi:phosphate uptake regulator
MGIPAPHPRKRPAFAAQAVVDLSLARDARRLRDFQARCHAVDDLNRRTLSRLFQTGQIFTRHGARLGRELLLAHQHLLRVTDLLARIGELPGSAPASEAAALYGEAQALLARTTELAARCSGVLARER